MDRYGIARRLGWLLCAVLLHSSAWPRVATTGTTLLSIGGYNGVRVPWKMSRMTLKSENKEIADMLRQLASNNDLAIQVDDRIKGTVSGTFTMVPQDILNLLGKSYGFFWFYDGNSIIVSPASDVKTELVRLAPEALSNFTSTLQRLGVYDTRFPIRVDEPNRLVVLSGPSRYVDMLSNISRALQDSVEQKSPTEVMVYPLKYAWAEDRVMPSGSNTVSIPGVVSVLRNIYRPNEERITTPSSVSSTRPRARRPVAGGSSDRNRYDFSERGPEDSGGSPVKEMLSQLTQSASAFGDSQGQRLPVIVADARRNAVVVRDLAERMPKHKALIQELDQRVALVEIEAKIIDVSSDAVESLGVDWRLSGSRADLQIGSASSNTALRFSGSLATDPVDTTVPIGGRFTLVGGNAARFLMSRIRALEQDGKARTVSTPRVTTLDNVQSVMTSKQVFYVKVPGTYSSQLFEVSAGVSLTVLPFVIREDEGNSVRIAVNITDGGVDGRTTVDGIPSTQQSEINAEAIVKEGASLLVAGYAREQESSAKSGVPLLSRLPGVGGLFRDTNTSTTRQERFFILTPRIITP